MKKTLAVIQKVQIAVAAFFLLIFLVTIAFQMFSRFAGIAATWTEDVCTYSFIWAVFMGAGAMVYEKRHFAFTSIMDMMKNKHTKKVLAVVIGIIMLIFAGLMVYYGFLAAKQFWNYTWVNIPSMKRGPTWLCLPVCGLTSALYLIGQIVEEIGELKKGDDE